MFGFFKLPTLHIGSDMALMILGNGLYTSKFWVCSFCSIFILSFVSGNTDLLLIVSSLAGAGGGLEGK